MTDQHESDAEFRQALEAALDWIDAVPADVVSKLGAMPGFDRDWVDGLLARRAVSPVPADDVERVARALYECEKKRAERARSIMASGKVVGCEGILIEPWEECAETFLSDARAAIAVMPAARSDAAGRPDVSQEALQWAKDTSSEIETDKKADENLKPLSQFRHEVFEQAGRLRGLREAAEIAQRHVRGSAAAHNEAGSAKQREIHEARCGLARTMERAILDRAAASQPAEAGGGRRAARDVLAERRRQVEVEGWTPEYDDRHNTGQLAAAAGCYALSAGCYRSTARIPYEWPWSAKWWKAGDKRQKLVKAGALILAEIERLDRLPPAPEVRR